MRSFLKQISSPSSDEVDVPAESNITANILRRFMECLKNVEKENFAAIFRIENSSIILPFARKEELKVVAEEIGETVAQEMKVADLRDLIFGSEAYKNDPESVENFEFDSSLEGGGGLITAGESSKSSDMLYSKASSSDAKEELISASASGSRDCKVLFPMEGQQPLVKAQCRQKQNSFEKTKCAPLTVNTLFGKSAVSTFMSDFCTTGAGKCPAGKKF
ncbi:hypothetical protein AVEN_87585-1, partial [Araneus ventricosus]